MHNERRSEGFTLQPSRLLMDQIWRGRRRATWPGLHSEAGFSLVEIIIVVAMLGVVGVALVGALASGVRGTDLVAQRSTALQLARSQIESIKNQPYNATPSAYATVAADNNDFVISVAGTELTAGFLEQIDVTVTYPRGSTTLSAYKVNHAPPVLAAAPVGAADPVADPGTEFVVYYLHDNPTPPMGDTLSQVDLPMDTTAPFTFVLNNYDTDRDASEGRVIAQGGVGAGETDLAKYQNWQTGALASGFRILGTVHVRLESAIKDFQFDKAGEVKVFLRELDGSTYTEIGNATLLDSDWHKGFSTFVEQTIEIPSVDYTTTTGRELELKVSVGDNASDTMWFAYDTDDFQARIFVPKET